MSRNVSSGAPGSRRGTSRAPRLRHFKTSGADLPRARSRSPDTVSSHSTARPESVPPSMRSERRCTVTVNESYSPDEVLLNLDLIPEIKPGMLASISVVKPESEKSTGLHPCSNKQQQTGDHGAGAKGPPRDEEGDSPKRRYVFYAKDMSKELKNRHPHVELYVLKHIADNFGMKKGTQVILAPVCPSFLHLPCRIESAAELLP